MGNISKYLVFGAGNKVKADDIPWETEHYLVNIKYGIGQRQERNKVNYFLHLRLEKGKYKGFIDGYIQNAVIFNISGFPNSCYQWTVCTGAPR